MIAADFFIKVVRHTRIEYFIHSLLANQMHYTAVHHLSRITNGIRWNCCLSLQKQITTAKRRTHHFITQTGQNWLPEMIVFIQVQTHRQTNTAPITFHALASENLIPFITERIVGDIDKVLLLTFHRSFTAVTGNQFPAIIKSIHCQFAVIPAQLANPLCGFMLEMIQRCGIQQLRLLQP